MSGDAAFRNDWLPYGACAYLAALRIIEARGRVRDLLRADGIEDKVGRIDHTVTLDGLLRIQGVASR